MYFGATILHCHSIHAVWELAGLPPRVQPGGGDCGRAAVHGHADLFRHGVPGEEKLHPPVGRTWRWPTINHEATSLVVQIKGRM